MWKSQTLDLTPTHLYLQTHRFLSQSYLSLSSSRCRTVTSAHTSQKHLNTWQQAKTSEAAFMIWLTNTSVMAVLICDSHSYNELSTLPRPLTVGAQWRAPCLAWPLHNTLNSVTLLWLSLLGVETLITWRRDCSHRLLQCKMISARGLILNIHLQFQTLWTFSSHPKTRLKGHLL